MAWTTPRTWVFGELVTASIGNTHWRDNLNALYAGAMSISGQAAGDLLIATSTTQLGRSTTYTGPVGIGSASAGVGFTLAGTVTPGGTFAAGMQVTHNLTPSAGQDAYGLRFYGQTFSKAGSGAHSAFIGFRYEPFVVGANAGSTLAAAVTLQIVGAPSGATVNQALRVDSGAVVFGGNVSIGGTTNTALALLVTGASVYQTHTSNTELMTQNTGSGTVTGGLQALTGGPLRIGTTTNHAIQLVVNNTPCLALDTSGQLTLVSGVINMNTADGSDNASLQFGGGGAIGQTRGANILIYGNEHASHGNVALYVGNVANSSLIIYRADANAALTLDGSTGIMTMAYGIAGPDKGITRTRCVAYNSATSSTGTLSETRLTLNSTVAGQTSGCTLSGNQITVSEAGEYLMSFRTKFDCGNQSMNLTFRVKVNGAVVASTGVMRHEGVYDAEPHFVQLTARITVAAGNTVDAFSLTSTTDTVIFGSATQEEATHLELHKVNA